MKNKQVIVSFDKTEHTTCESVRPEKYDDFKALNDTPVIARGAGLSYCNAGASESATVVDMSRMNRITDFRPEKEFITVEAGLTIGELHNFLISKGFILPVLPGYPTITIGGCIGFNVHGKSEFKVGTFGNWVRSLVLFHPAKGEVILSQDQNPDLFNLTIGGMGLTGIILSATLKISKLPGNRLHVEQRKVSSASEAVKMMTESSSDYEYVYSWNNFNCYDNSFGKGFVYLEKYEQGQSRLTTFRDRLKLSYKLPAVQNPFFTRMMCLVYYQMNSLKSSRYNLDISTGSFPIYGKEIYYNLFGRKGFREYQVLLPANRWENAFAELNELLKSKRYPIALGSLKIFKGKPHHISFSGDGVCLTIDVAASDRSLELFSHLDDWCMRHQGIVNLSKDSRIGESFANKAFPKMNEFRDAIRKSDPGNHLRSELKNRLGI